MRNWFLLESSEQQRFEFVTNSSACLDVDREMDDFQASKAFASNDSNNTQLGFVQEHYSDSPPNLEGSQAEGTNIEPREEHIQANEQPMTASAESKKKKTGKRKCSSRTPTLTVECSQCLKWRIVPNERDYEIIRSKIYEDPFICEMASTWGRNVSCTDPQDITVEESGKMWAIDTPDVPCKPNGWKRKIHLRKQTSTRFSDICYISPCGRKINSMAQIRRFLEDNPRYIEEGIEAHQFDFRGPTQGVHSTEELNKA